MSDCCRLYRLWRNALQSTSICLCYTPVRAFAALIERLHSLTWPWAVQGVQGISDIITIPGLVNVDFADVKAVMCNSGTAMLGVGVATGKNRAEEAALVRTLCLCHLTIAC